MKKILFSLLMASPLMASAFDAQIDGFYYDFKEDGKAFVVYGSLGSYSGDVVIPSKVTYNGVEYTVTGIGENAFASCKELTSVKIPESIVSLGYSAFSGCTGLTSINIPSSVSSISEESFANCYNLTSVNIDPANENYSSGNNANCILDLKTKTIIFGCSTTTIPLTAFALSNTAFASCLTLTNITISSNIEKIGVNTFYGCANLTNITNLATTPQEISKSTFGKYEGVTLHVLPGCKAAYESAAVWKDFQIVDDAVDTETHCYAPRINFNDGKLTFTCRTSNADLHYSIKSIFNYEGVISSGTEIPLDSKFVVSAYATADGYAKSTTTTIDVDFSNTVEVEKEIVVYVYDGQLDKIDVAEGQQIGLTISNGVVYLYDAPLNSVVYVYNVGGEAVAQTEVSGKEVSFKLSSGIYVFKVGEKTFKVKL